MVPNKFKPGDLRGHGKVLGRRECISWHPKIPTGAVSFLLQFFLSPNIRKTHDISVLPVLFDRFSLSTFGASIMRWCTDISTPHIPLTRGFTSKLVIFEPRKCSYRCGSGLIFVQKCTGERAANGMSTATPTQSMRFQRQLLFTDGAN